MYDSEVRNLHIGKAAATTFLAFLLKITTAVLEASAISHKQELLTLFQYKNDLIYTTV